MNLKVIRFLLVAILFAFTFIPNVFASGSGGFRLPASDAEAMGKAGAFVGEADNASAVYYNPAGMTQLDGNNISLGFAWANIFVDHTSPAGVETQMHRENAVVPHFYYVSDLGSDKYALGFSVKSDYGAATEWAEDSFSRYVSTRSETTNIDFLINLAYQVNDRWSVGAGLKISDSEFAQGKNVFQASGDAEAQLKMKDTAFSQSLSTLYKFNEKHQLGLHYRSRTNVDYGGFVDVNGLSGALETIFGDTSYQTTIAWDISLPQSAVIGYSFRPNDKWIINVDVEWTDWSSIEQENIHFPEEPDATRVSTLDSLADLIFDWKSSWAYSIGGEYRWNEKIKLRSGYFFHETPIPSVNFNTFVPDSNSHGINLGVGYALSDSAGLDFAWSGIFFEDRNVSSSTNDSANSSIIGNYEEYINVATLTFSYSF